MECQPSNNLLRIAVLVSGPARGTTLQALLDACSNGTVAGRVAVVIATRADAPALERARAGGVDGIVISPRKYEGDEAGYAAALVRAMDSRGVGLVCLAGYLLKLPAEVIRHFAGRVMNVHPALLPLFGGRGMYGERVYEAVIASGVKVSGCTVHFVDEQYDTGPIIAQRPVPVLEGDTPELLAARVRPEERSAYVEAVRLYAQRRLRIVGGTVQILPVE